MEPETFEDQMRGEKKRKHLKLLALNHLSLLAKLGFVQLIILGMSLSHTERREYVHCEYHHNYFSFLYLVITLTSIHAHVRKLHGVSWILNLIFMFVSIKSAIGTNPSFVGESMKAPKLTIS